MKRIGALVVAFSLAGSTQTAYAQSVGKSSKAKVAVAEAPAAPPAQERIAAKAWIGVRLDDVPEVLRAHVGRGGLMIQNVVVDSPADEAGLQRFDIIVSLDDKPVETQPELREAIEAVARGSAAKITILRGGREQTLKVTPTAPPEKDVAELSFRYELPQAQDEATRYFGWTWNQGPDGQWRMTPLGRMGSIPFDPQAFAGQAQMPPGSWAPEPGKFYTFGDQDWAQVFGGVDADSKSTWTYSHSDDSGSLEIRRNPDGTMHVRREKGGRAVTENYSNEKELEDRDADAFRVYQRVRGGQRPVIVTPSLDELPGMQQDFQQRIEESFREAKERLQTMRQQMDQLRSQMPSKSGAFSSSDFSFRRDASGRVHVEIQRDGQKRVYDYDSLEELRNHNPDVYELIQEWIEGLRGEQRGQLSAHVARA